MPRGELFAIMYVLCRALAATTITFVTDNKGNFQLFHDKEKATRSNNKDIFNMIYELIQDKCISFELIWMPSHLKTRPDKKRPEYVTDFDIEANDEADRLADVAANKYQIEVRFAAPYLQQVESHRNSAEADCNCHDIA